MGAMCRRMDSPTQPFRQSGALTGRECTRTICDFTPELRREARDCQELQVRSLYPPRCAKLKCGARMSARAGARSAGIGGIQTQICSPRSRIYTCLAWRADAMDMNTERWWWRSSGGDRRPAPLRGPWGIGTQTSARKAAYGRSRLQNEHRHIVCQVANGDTTTG